MRGVFILCSIIELVRTHFAPQATRNSPRENSELNGGEATSLTISSFSLASFNSKFAERITEILANFNLSGKFFYEK